MTNKKSSPASPKNEAQQAVVVSPQGGLPTLAGASQELIERVNEVRENLESVESFTLPRVRMTASGLELIEGEAPLMELEGVILHTKKTNVYYAKAYNPSEKLPPDCYSLDGVLPAAKIEKPINKTCKGCPMAEFGTNSMKSGKACRNLKPMYLLLSDNAIMPRQLTVTPASLKLANQYLLELTERGVAYRKVKTKIKLFKDNPKDTYYKMRFTMGAKLDEQAISNVEYLKRAWLSTMDEQLGDIEVEPAQSVKDEPKDLSNGDF